MTEENEPQDQGDTLAKMRDEFAAQFKELKDAFEAERAEKDKLIAELKEQNQGLQRALVRSAVTDPPKEEAKEKTEEEIYKEEIDRLAKRSLELMKEVI